MMKSTPWAEPTEKDFASGLSRNSPTIWSPQRNLNSSPSGPAPFDERARDRGASFGVGFDGHGGSEAGGLSVGIGALAAPASAETTAGLDSTDEASLAAS